MGPERMFDGTAAAARAAAGRGGPRARARPRRLRGRRRAGAGRQEADREAGQGGARRRPRLLQLVRVPRPEADQEVREAVRRQGPRVQLRLDAGHDGQAAVGQPLRPDLPGRRVRSTALTQGQPAAEDRPRPAQERGHRLRLLRRPLVRPGRRPHGAVRDVHDRPHLPRGQGRTHDRLLERPRHPGGAEGQDLHARRLPGGHRRGQPASTATTSTTTDPDELEKAKQTLLDQKPNAARLLHRRHPEHGLRQRLDPPRLERRRRQRPQPGRRTRRTTRSRSARRASRSAPTASRSRPTPQHPGTALLFIDFMLEPENASAERRVHRLPDAVHGRRTRRSPSWPRTTRRSTSPSTTSTNGQQYANLSPDGRASVGPGLDGGQGRRERGRPLRRDAS